MAAVAWNCVLFVHVGSCLKHVYAISTVTSCMALGCSAQQIGTQVITNVLNITNLKYTINDFVSSIVHGGFFQSTGSDSTHQPNKHQIWSIHPFLGMGQSPMPSYALWYHFRCDEPQELPTVFDAHQRSARLYSGQMVIKQYKTNNSLDRFLFLSDHQFWQGCHGRHTWLGVNR